MLRYARRLAHSRHTAPPVRPMRYGAAASSRHVRRHQSLLLIRCCLAMPLVRVLGKKWLNLATMEKRARANLLQSFENRLRVTGKKRALIQGIGRQGKLHTILG